MTFDIGDNVRVVCEDDSVVFGKIILIDEIKMNIIIYDNKKTIKNRKYKSVGFSNQKVLSFDAKQDFIKYVTERYISLL